ncbi:protein of unknown function [Oribacterium sp. KHPX15]|uniref:DUF4358 domain-containing protein n=1 Tax=Oribacterium sp. KHPX15 TaxID=1855342 RepID=UPI0008943852|nr:DUF4358 domain-containing protein [Oribacterium sp. KHPX15]SEA59069.1 protein of unknown function [Oribacterium sp. KHPX15]
MRKTIVATTLAVITASALMLNGCGKKAEAEAVTTAAVETTAVAEETTAEETTTAAEETTAAAEETTAAAEETTAAAEESSESEEESTEESSKEEETTEETTKEETTTAEETTVEETTVEETTAEETKAQSSGADPSAIYSQVTGLLPGMINVDANYIANYYGIDASQLEGYVFAMAEDVTHADTVAILKAKDASSVAALAGQLSAVQQQKAQELQDYMPDQYQIVAASSVKTAGNYVYLVMSPNAAAIEQTIASNIG